MDKARNVGGRPQLPADQRLVQRSIRLRQAHWDAIDQHGGIDWLRERLEQWLAHNRSRKEFKR